MRTEAEPARHLADASGGQPALFLRWFRRILPLRGWVIALSLLLSLIHI